ncbi:MAG: hypothetical protein ACR2FG_08205 [Marmoricola sp.]
MKNITVAVPDEVYREARIRAAEQGTSVSSLVSEYLGEISGEASEFLRLEAQQRRIQSDIGPFRACDRVGRDEIHDRSVR